MFNFEVLFRGANLRVFKDDNNFVRINELMKALGLSNLRTKIWAKGLVENTQYKVANGGNKYEQGSFVHPDYLPQVFSNMKLDPAPHAAAFDAIKLATNPNIEQVQPVNDTIEVNNELPCIQYNTLFLNGISIIRRASDGYVNATLLCQAGGKIFGNWHKTDHAKAFIKVLSAKLSNAQLIQQLHGRNSTRHMWVHPQVAINIAQWIPEFSVQVTTWIECITKQLNQAEFTIANYDELKFKETEQSNINSLIEMSSAYNLHKLKDAHVCYIIYIGMHDNCFVFKFGRSMRFEGRFDEHIHTFGKQIKLISIMITLNESESEALFNQYIKKSSLAFTRHNNSELFFTTHKHNIYKVVAKFSQICNQKVYVDEVTSRMSKMNIELDALKSSYVNLTKENADLKADKEKLFKLLKV